MVPFLREKKIIFISICLGIIFLGIGVIDDEEGVVLHFLCTAAILLWPYRDKPSFKLNSLSVKKVCKKELQKGEIQNNLIESKVKTVDENFIAEDLISWIKSMFLKYQIAYEKEEWDLLSPFFTENLITQERKRPRRYEQKNKKMKFEKIDSVELVSFETKEEKEYLKVKVLFRNILEEYDVKGKLIRGLTKNNIPYICIILLERKKGIKTEKNEYNMHCSNCGAPTHILTNGKCKFCGEVIKIEKENWKWANISISEDNDFTFFNSTKAEIEKNKKLDNLNVAKMQINENNEFEEKLLELNEQGINILIKDLFKNVQEALNSYDLDKLMLLEDGLLFERDSQKLQRLEKDGKKLVRKDVVIHSVEAYSYERDNEYEIVSSLIKATLEDYIYVKGSDDIEEGIRDYNVTKSYRLVIKRKFNFEKGSNIERCKNCGATIKFNAVGKCSYCGNMLYSDEFNWIVSEFTEV